MKADLNRIKATLQNLGISTASYPEPPATQNRSYSFEIGSSTKKRNSAQQPRSKGRLIPPSSVQRLPAQQITEQEPVLPNFNSNINRTRRDSTPALKKKLLPDYTDNATCVAEIQKIMQQIRHLYLEGPIVDGWLESQQYTPPKNMTRHNDSIEPKMDYVQEVCNIEQGKVTCESPRAGYVLCGLDAAGKKWSRPCPVEQLASVSIAIARYQKLQQLLERKHYFESCLQQNEEEQ